MAASVVMLFLKPYWCGERVGREESGREGCEGLGIMGWDMVGVTAWAVMWDGEGTFHS